MSVLVLNDMLFTLLAVFVLWTQQALTLSPEAWRSQSIYQVLTDRYVPFLSYKVNPPANCILDLLGLMAVLLPHAILQTKSTVEAHGQVLRII